MAGGFAFASGMNCPGEARPFVQLGHPIGAVAGLLSGRMRKVYRDYAGAGGKVFIDSGAFGAARKGEAVDFETVFGVYDDVAQGCAQPWNIWVVAPDILGDQDGSMALLAEWRERIEALESAGVNILVPMQKGALKGAALFGAIDAALEHRVSWVPAVPFNKYAWTDEEVVEFSDATWVERIHLLGGGMAAVERLDAVCEKTTFQGDSMRMRGWFGAANPVGRAQNTLAPGLAAVYQVLGLDEKAARTEARRRIKHLSVVARAADQGDQELEALFAGSQEDTTMKMVDLFAGCGGSSAGAMEAGIQVVWAGNHWPDAVDIHSRNHPDAHHVCQDLQQADWSQLPDHDVLWASPACQGHSLARGAERVHHDATRSTAWAVISCAEAKRPPVVCIENVPAFQSWVLFEPWCAALRALGYTLSSSVIDSADCGVPQNRERWYMVATRSQAQFPIQQPSQAHVAASSFIDLDGGNWTRVADKVKATRERVAAGLATFGSQPFLTPYYGSGSGRMGRSLDRPIGTLTTRDRWAIVKPGPDPVQRFLSVDECRAAMGFPAGYQLPRKVRLAKYMLGNAVTPPVATELLTQIQRAA